MRLQILAAAAVFAASLSIHATTLASATDGTGGTALYDNPYQGQSFLVTGSGSFDDITFNFYSAPSTPFAAGTGYLFAAPYAGTPAGLSSAGALGTATSSGGVYTFDSGLTLTAGDEYYFYEDAAITSDITGFSSYSSGTNYYSGGSTYGTYPSTNFLVTGQAVSPTPEPSSFVLLGTGLLGIAGAVRRRMRLGEGSQTGC